ncbi:MAG: CAP domain-containing protein [Pseudohongiella sp.]|uniref:CAP domain-containing protein n=1 Tax=Pseudohongiella sp. TaxID=1979412 RepID=UPI0034A05212
MNSPSAIITMLVLGLSQSLPAIAKQSGNINEGYRIDTTQRSTVSLFYRTVFRSSEGVDSGWNGNIQGCDAGDTSAEYKSAVLRRINWFRAMAGVPANVELDPELNAKAQQAALLMSANRSLSHYPPSDWTCFGSDASEAAAKSNLALGNAGPDAMVAYMEDYGDTNSAVGHRRWLLHPKTLRMGTGDVFGSLPSNTHWVVSSTHNLPRPAVRDDFVAWPPPGHVPFDMVFPRWSISYPKADFSGATVSMSLGGVQVQVQLETVRDGPGENTLVWLADGYADGERWEKPSGDTKYEVLVENVIIGGKPITFSYNVTVFDPEQDIETPTIIAEVGIQENSSALVFETSIKEGALQYQWRQSMLSPFTLHDTADNGLLNFKVSHNSGYHPHIDADSNGESYFRLAHPSGTRPGNVESLELREELLVGPGSQLQFKSRMGLSTNNQIASVEISLDSGMNWQSIYLREGDRLREPLFSEKSVSLAPWQGRVVRLRFQYSVECNASCSFYLYEEGSSHWDIDDVRLSGVEKASELARSLPLSEPQVAFTPAEAGRQLLQSRAGMYGQFDNWGSAYVLSVSASQLKPDSTAQMVIQPTPGPVEPIPGVDAWLGHYNGVSPDPALGLQYNNIGILDLSTLKAYSCVRFLANGEPSVMDGVEQMDIIFDPVSLQNGTIQVSIARAFNQGNALTESAEWPDCSGTFDMNTGVYADTLQVGDQVFRTEFALRDDTLLIFELLTADEVLP